jgi:hypothetical protein
VEELAAEFRPPDTPGSKVKESSFSPFFSVVLTGAPSSAMTRPRGVPGLRTDKDRSPGRWESVTVAQPDVTDRHSTSAMSFFIGSPFSITGDLTAFLAACAGRRTPLVLARANMKNVQ